MALSLYCTVFSSSSDLLIFWQTPKAGVPDSFLRCEVLLNHFQAEVFCLREDEVDDWREDDDKDAEHEEGSIKSQISFQQWEKLD